MNKYYQQRSDSDVSMVSDASGPLDELVSPISDNDEEQHPRATSSFYGSPPKHQTISDGSTVRQLCLPDSNEGHQAYIAVGPYDDSNNPFGDYLPPPNERYIPNPCNPQQRPPSVSQQIYERTTAAEAKDRASSDRARRSSHIPDSSKKKWWQDTRNRAMFLSGCTLVLVAISGIAGVFVWMYDLPKNKEKDGR